MKWRSAMVVLSLGGVACLDFDAALGTCSRLGRCQPPCTTDTDCAAGLVCAPASSRCEVAPDPRACPWPPFPAVAPCGNDRDLFLSPAGLDGNPGTRERPRRTLQGLTLLPGDRIHLGAGTWTEGLFVEGDGTAECPITLSGAPDGGTFFQLADESLRVSGSFFRVSDLRVEGGPAAPVYLGRANGGRIDEVWLRRVDVHIPVGGQTHVLIERCTGCVVEASTFSQRPNAVVTNAVQLWSSTGLVVRGNHVTHPTVSPAIETRSGTTNLLVLGNRFTGARPAAFDGSGGVFARNVVTDVSSGTLVAGAAAVLHNTFLRLGTSTVASGGRFSGNLVSIAGLARTGTEGGYNLFNAVRPSLDGGLAATDLVALPKLDATDTPDDGSPALDAADPASPVPPGGGARADIGALERGALRLPDGRYCLAPDAGW